MKPGMVETAFKLRVGFVGGRRYLALLLVVDRPRNCTLSLRVGTPLPPPVTDRGWRGLEDGNSFGIRFFLVLIMARWRLAGTDLLLAESLVGLAVSVSFSAATSA